MTNWWQQAMFRNMKPNINIQYVVEARIWKTGKGKEALGKLVYEIGRYDERYWRNISHYQSESDFIVDFAKMYI